MEMRPAWARSYEPAAVSSLLTVRNIRELQNFYSLTGDRRYLEPIPRALDWLELSRLKPGGSQGGPTHARFYEPGTNKPLYTRHQVKDGKIDSYVVTYEPSTLPAYGTSWSVDLSAVKRAYEEIRAMSFEKASAIYGRPKPESTGARVTAEEVSKIIRSLDERGAWLTDIKFLDTSNYIDNPPLQFRGIDIKTYASNMTKLIQYLKQIPGGG